MSNSKSKTTTKILNILKYINHFYFIKLITFIIKENKKIDIFYNGELFCF